MYKAIAEELRFAGLGNFDFSTDYQGEIPFKSYVGINATRNGDGDWQVFEEVRGAITAARGKNIDWGDLTTQGGVEEIIQRKILELEERKAANTGVELKTLLQEKLQDPRYLPTREEIIRAFTTNEEFTKYCKSQGSYEVLTREFIDSMRRYIFKDLPMDESKSLSVLEVRAGNGRLSYFLQERFKRWNMQDKVHITAVDDESWFKEDEQTPIQPTSALFTNGEIDYRPLDYKEALTQIHPDIVISSWMPPNVDWTPDFRNQEGTGEVSGQISANDTPPFSETLSRTAAFRRIRR